MTNEQTNNVRMMKHVTLERLSKVIANNLKLLAKSRNLSLYELQNQIVEAFLLKHAETEIRYVPSTHDDKNRYNVFVSNSVFTQILNRGIEAQKSNAEIVYNAIICYARVNGLNNKLL
ncbi:hypothetical protein [Yersinia enterocolitica]|uniref:hypothetical protein n=1 Tax=Yersinia enterocolitica TaxID=630 RepID=UPI0005DE9A4F|nr:hypothetical protein [Yersinia enterocolitica]CNF98486.1 Uncharacterised protein [Yersinia enterocolitica]